MNPGLRPHAALLAMLGFLIPLAAHAQSGDPDPERFTEEIDAFARWDAKNAPPDDPIVFVGSSSIRFWNTAERFPLLPIVNRGFGGAHISDVNHFLEQTVLRYAPSVIVFYAGDNDIGAGKSKETVLEDYGVFVQSVWSDAPSAQIVFIPIKPSLARWELWPEMELANQLVRDFSQRDDRLHYVDVATPMLGEDGRPRPELFIRDGLHMTAEGYDVWTGPLAEYLASLERSTSSVAARAHAFRSAHRSGLTVQTARGSSPFHPVKTSTTPASQR